MPTFIAKMTDGSDYLTALQQSVITGLLLAGCFVGSLFAGESIKDQISKV